MRPAGGRYRFSTVKGKFEARRIAANIAKLPELVREHNA
jgi:hypothetical protein